ncbi:hypothetical protein B0H13DRAFT_2055623 [Mycena leptocephala]|nr:hypothetical protein B0H13DRAFT_2055623 [Mycena leptocephala]
MLPNSFGSSVAARVFMVKGKSADQSSQIMSSYTDDQRSTTNPSPPAQDEDNGITSALQETAVQAAAQAFALLLGADSNIINIPEFQTYYHERVKHWANMPLQEWSDGGSTQILQGHTQIIENIYTQFDRKHEEAARFEKLVNKEDKDLGRRREKIESTRDKLIKK